MIGRPSCIAGNPARKPKTKEAPQLQFVIRFVVGGLIVTLFAAIADITKPKSFAGLFGAAPSVALASLALAIFSNGKNYAALEARSMIVGASAFFLYAQLTIWLIMRFKIHAGPAALSAIGVWLLWSVGIWALVLR
jgi:Protein of unknown function (DUF3147)